MRRTLLITVALAMLAAGAVAFAPAVLVGTRLERLSGGKVVLAVPEGTIWRGRATLVASPEARLPLAWSIDPWPLLRGELRFSLFPHDDSGRTPRGEIALSDDTIAVRGLDLALPANLLRLAGPGTDLRATGEVRVTSSALDWAPTGSRGEVEIVWRDARIVAGNGDALVLGRVTVVLSASGDRLAGPVVNEGGDVGVVGTVSLRADAGEFSLLLAPRHAADAALARSLAAIGTPVGAGWRVEWRTGAQ
jgi:general secretion pathway protein N